jgi:hypothetical protein
MPRSPTDFRRGPNREPAHTAIPLLGKEEKAPRRQLLETVKDRFPEQTPRFLHNYGPFYFDLDCGVWEGDRPPSVNRCLRDDELSRLKRRILICMALVVLVSGGLVFFYSTGPPGWPWMIGCIILQHQQGQST